MTALVVDLRRPEHAYLADHVVLGWTALPGAFVLAAALDAAGEGRAVEGLGMPGLVALEEDAPLTVEVGEADDGSWRFGALAQARLVAAGAAQPRPSAEEDLSEELDAVAFYDALAALGATYGPAFRGVRSVRLGEGGAVADVVAPPGLEPQASHPAVLDACAQAALAALGLGTAALPVSVARARRHAPLPEAVRSHARVRAGTAGAPGETVVDVQVRAMDGSALLDLDGIVLRGRRRR